VVYTVKIDPSPDQKDRDTNDNKYRQEQLKAVHWLNVISAIGVLVATLALIGLTINACLIHGQLSAEHEANRISKASSELAYRPYIGVDSITPLFYWEDAKGEHFSQRRDPQANILDFIAHIKNFGPVPGTNFVANWKIFVGGQLETGRKIPDRPFTLYPGQPANLSGQIGTNDFPSIMNGTKTLVVRVMVWYDGPSGHYQECDKRQFLPEVQAFANLGPCSW
jgi:hypothetical protein